MALSSTPERIGTIGGSFDPVHCGHLMIARDAAEHLGLSEVLFMPAALPPHKTHVRQVDAAHRVNMLRLATECDRRFCVSDLEIRRGGVSYTIDTVEELREVYPKAELFLLIGSDTLVELHTWHRIDELIEMCTVATILRPGIDSPDAIRQKMKLDVSRREKLLAQMISAHRMDISSTEIRRRVAAGERISGLVPAEVEAYIFEYGLYHR